MFQLWQKAKLEYLRSANRLDIATMRKFNLSNNVIKQVFLDQLNDDLNNMDKC